MVVWLLLGGIIGSGVGYFAFVKQPAAFESEATVLVTRGDSDSGSQTDVTDDSELIIGRPILADAIASRSLNGVPEFQGPSGIVLRDPDDKVRALTKSDRLAARQLSVASEGSIYEIRFRGATPSSSKRVLDVLLATCLRSLPRTGDQKLWRESVELLGDSRREVAERIAELESQQSPEEHPEGAIIDQKLVSANVERLRVLRQTSEQLQIELDSIESSLRHAEKMMNENVPIESVLVSLGQPVSTFRSAPASDNTDSATERENRAAERKRVEQSVAKELKPLQDELDKLLERFGPNHPTVRGVRTKIETVRSKLDEISPFDSVEPAIAVDPNPVSDPEEDSAKKRIQVDRILTALRAERSQVSESLAETRERLEAITSTTAKEEIAARQRDRIEDELKQQRTLLKQISDRVDQIPASSPFPKIEVTILDSPDEGVQVEPELSRFLLRGGTWGAAGGAALAMLLLLTTIASGNNTNAD